MERRALATTFALAWAVVAGCGTTENGGGAATPADEQMSTSAPEAQPGPPTAEPPAPKVDGPKTPISGGPCTTAADCVPASCCHAKACVDKARKPACEGMMCTMDCRGGTMDCGGGSCACVDGTCTAQLKTSDLMKKLAEIQAAKKAAEEQPAEGAADPK
jgi:hypothetical protein